MRAALILVLACGGCTSEVCNSFDLECFLRGLTLRDDDGTDVPITIVKRESAEAVIGGWSDPGSTSEEKDLGEVPRDFAVPVDLRVPFDFAIPAPPVMLGCFVDRLDARDLSASGTYSSSMSRELCAQICAAYPYFGLQDGAWCYCGNSYGAHGTAPSSDCYMPCSGSAAQTCGGYLRNTVYGKSSFEMVDMAVGPDLGGGATSGGTTGGTSGGTTGGTTGGGGGNVPIAQTPTLMPETTSASIMPGMPAPIGIGYHDPNKCTPGFCMSMCRRGGRCATVMACVPPRRDGILDGVWRSNLGTRYEPADTPSLEALLPLIGVGTVNCGDFIPDIQKVEQGQPNPNTSGAVSTALVTMNLTIARRVASSSSGSTGGTTGGSTGGTTGGASQCSGYQSPGCSGATCSYRACASAGVGTCSAWYETGGGQRFTCSACQSCTTAAQAVINYCCPRQP